MSILNVMQFNGVVLLVEVVVCKYLTGPFTSVQPAEAPWSAGTEDTNYTNDVETLKQILPLFNEWGWNEVM